VVECPGASPIVHRGSQRRQGYVVDFLRACFENSEGCCFSRKGCMARRDEGAYPLGSVTEEQRSQAAFSAKTLRATGLCAGSALGRRLQLAAGMLWPRRSAPRNFQTGSKIAVVNIIGADVFEPWPECALCNDCRTGLLSSNARRRSLAGRSSPASHSFAQCPSADCAVEPRLRRARFCRSGSQMGG